MKMQVIRIAQVLLVWLVVAGQARAAENESPRPSGAVEGAAELVNGDVGKAIATYTDALKDTGSRQRPARDDPKSSRRGQHPPRPDELALEDYNRAVELFPEYPVAYNNRGNLLLSIGQLGEAMKDFDRALLLAPGYAAAYSNRGNAKLKLGKPAEAVADFTKAIELMPASAAPLSGRGLAHLATGKPHAAIRDFRVPSAPMPASRPLIAIGPRRALPWVSATKPSRIFPAPSHSTSTTRNSTLIAATPICWPATRPRP